MFEARLRWAKQYPDFVPTIMNDGKNTYINLRGVNYLVTTEFMHRYAKIVDSEEEADKLIFEENAEWELLSAELFNSKNFLNYENHF
jgi:hypothetical protein